MQDFQEDLVKEQRNIKAIFKYFKGIDISKEKKEWDIGISKLQMKTWLRNGYLPLETWNVIEDSILGWAVESWSNDVTYVFRCPERKESLFISGDEIYNFMLDHRIEISEPIKCRHCGKIFSLPRFEGDGIKHQMIQYTGRKKGWPGGYHSAMIEVHPRVFPRLYTKELEAVIQMSLL